MVVQGELALGAVVAFASGFERLIDPARELLGFYRRWSQMRVQHRLIHKALEQQADGQARETH